MATTRGKRKSNKRFGELQQEAVLPRRSPRISERYGGTRVSSNYPLIVTARSTIHSYNTNILNESGQSVPSSYDTDLSSFETGTENSIVQHDHTYFNPDHAHTPFMLTTHEAPVPISTSSPTHLYGLDYISGGEEDDEERDIHSSKEFNRHYKDRTITPRKPPPPQGPSFISSFCSQIIRLFYSIGSFFYLLSNVVFSLEVSLLHKFGQVCNGPNGRRSWCGLLMLIAIFCLLSFCLIAPFIEYPVVAPPSPPSSSIPPPSISSVPVPSKSLPPPITTSTVVSTVTATVTSTPIVPPPNTDKIFDDIYKLINQLQNSLDQSDKERAQLRAIVNSIDIDKSLKDQLDVVDRKIRESHVEERAKTNDLILQLEKTLQTSFSAAINRSSLLEKSLKEELGKRPLGALTEERVEEIVQQIVKETNDKLSQFIDSSIKEDQRLNKELGKIKDLLKDMPTQSQVNELQTRLDAFSNNFTSMLSDLSNDVGANKAAELLKWQTLETQLKNHAATLKFLEDSINALKNAPSVTGGVSEQFVWDAIKSSLFNYSADNIARLDFALESVGGQVVDSSETYDPSGSRAQIFGINLPISVSRSSPTAVIQASVLPGECWCFKGSKGYVTIKLAYSLYVDAVSIQHIPKVISAGGSIRSAPKSIQVFGSQASSLFEDSFQLGTIEYKSDGSPIQTFPLPDKGPLSYIRFQVESNHGSPSYTCLYRIRVHGVLQKN